MVGAGNGARGETPDAHLLRIEVRATERLPLGNDVRDSGFRRLFGEGRQQCALRFFGAVRQLRAAGGRHDGRQAVDPLRMFDGHALGDHAAHREAHHMRPGLS